MPEEQVRGDLQLPPGVTAGQRQDPGAWLISSYRVDPGQIVGEATWLQRVARVLRFIWPLVVIVLFVIVLTALAWWESTRRATVTTQAVGPRRGGIDLFATALVEAVLQQDGEAENGPLEDFFLEFEVKDDVERRFWSWWVMKGKRFENEDGLVAFCFVKPEPHPLPPRLYDKQGHNSRVVKIARVTATASKPLVLLLARKGRACRVCESGAYDEKAKKWITQPDILKGEKVAVRRAVAVAVAWIDPGMPALVGLP